MRQLVHQQQVDQPLLPQALPSSLPQTQAPQKSFQEYLKPVTGQREHCKARSTMIRGGLTQAFAARAFVRVASTFCGGH